MSSSVFFRFKSQREPSRVAFDGTGISVFELKREIITSSRLGDGTDFELVISSEDTNEEYDDDTSIIPRSTTVVAKRLPAIKAGRGGAARYISGKMPQNAKNSHRLEASSTKPVSSMMGSGSTAVNGAQTEEEKMNAVLQMGADQWAQQQQEMANVAPVHRAGQMKGKPQNVPDRPPPPGYLCYRCGLKGHWIHVCPTNGDPEYENRPRIKRTTGIPRSFLKTVEKPIAIANDGTVDDTKHPSGIMVNADGEFVVAEPDQASWDQYQAKTKVPAATMEAAVRSSKELQEKGLECSIDKRLFVDPTKTPCCHTTFCHDCLTNALLENDLRCPGCSTDNVLIDDLMPDEETTAKIRIYEEEKAADKLRNEKLKSSVKREPMSIPKPADSPSKDSASSPSVPSQYQKVKSPSKKRAAESELDNNRTPPGPLEKETTQTEADGTRSKFRTQNAAASSMPFPFSGTTNMMLPGMNTMSMPNMNNFMGWPMSTGPQIALNPAMNNIMNTNNPFMNTDFSNRWNMGFAQQNMNMGMNGLGFQSGTMPDSGYNQPNMLMGNNHMNNNTGKGMNGGGGRMNNQGQGNFANQQRTSFGATTNNEEDSAYFRKPVNPHRHQARRNFNRPTDYREI